MLPSSYNIASRLVENQFSNKILIDTYQSPTPLVAGLWIVLKFSVHFLVYCITLPCISLLSLCFGYACPLLTLLQLRPILWCFMVYFRVISGDLTCGFLSGIQDLRLFMHLLCTTLGHDISNNLLTPS